MKHVYLISTLIFFFFLNLEIIQAQSNFPVPIKGRSITYEEVISAGSNMSQIDLYYKTKQWVAEYLPASASYNPLQLDDMENGYIIVQIKLKTIYPVKTATTGPWNVMCYGKILVKNGKYKYTFSNFKYTNDDQNEYNRHIKLDGFDWMFDPMNKLQKYQMEILELIDLQMKKIIDTLKETMKESKTNDF
jgi:Domain of unknown function (DUF4468) with TBP-like fold